MGAQPESGTEKEAGTDTAAGTEPAAGTAPETDEEDEEGQTASLCKSLRKTRRLSESRFSLSHTNLEEHSNRQFSNNFGDKTDRLGCKIQTWDNNTDLDRNRQGEGLERNSVSSNRSINTMNDNRNSLVCSSSNSFTCSASSTSETCSSPNSTVGSTFTGNSSERLTIVKNEQLSEEETSCSANTQAAKKISIRHENRRPPELSLAAIHSGAGGDRPEMMSATRQDHSPYSPHHPLRDYYYQSLYARFAAYPLHHMPGYPHSPPFFAAGSPGAALPFPSMSPSLSPSSPQSSSPSPYSRQFLGGHHFDFGKSHLL
jgi:hypothetical protein